MHLEQLLVGELGEERLDATTQLDGAPAGGVDHIVGAVAHVGELDALAADGVGVGLALARDGVAAAHGAVAAAQRLVGGVEIEDLVGDVVVGEGVERVEQLVEEALAAQVAHDGEVATHTRVNAHHLREREQKARRQVVNDVVAEVLEGVHGLGAAGAAHARDDHDVGNRLALGGAVSDLRGRFGVVPVGRRAGGCRVSRRCVGCLSMRHRALGLRRDARAGRALGLVFHSCPQTCRLP